jgi:catechol 2,3-dioxygenase-like lactoylglutathione lyase family enzyme
MSRPMIRHLAVFVRDVEKVAEFYESVFEMDVLHRTVATETEGAAVFLSDGHLTLAVLPQRLKGEVAHGINHFGFSVDNMEEVSARIKAAGVEAPQKRPSTRAFAELRGCDPEGILFDLSENGYTKSKASAEPATEKAPA